MPPDAAAFVTDCETASATRLSIPRISSHASQFVLLVRYRLINTITKVPGEDSLRTVKGPGGLARTSDIADMLFGWSLDGFTASRSGHAIGQIVTEAPAGDRR